MHCDFVVTLFASLCFSSDHMGASQFSNVITQLMTSPNNNSTVRVLRGRTISIAESVVRDVRRRFGSPAAPRRASAPTINIPLARIQIQPDLLASNATQQSISTSNSGDHESNSPSRLSSANNSNSNHTHTHSATHRNFNTNFWTEPNRLHHTKIHHSSATTHRGKKNTLTHHSVAVTSGRGNTTQHSTFSLIF